MINSGKILPAGILNFFALILGTIVFTYIFPQIISTVWYIIILILYFRSKDESLWLAFFFVLSDGFAGFFGTYEVSLSLIPGLPGIELGQFYILLSFVKVLGKQKTYTVFFNKYLQILGLYLLFLILWGLLNGAPSEINEMLRIFKLTVPFLLFYSLPKLLRSHDDFERFFGFVFPIIYIAFVTHIFSIIFGLSPAEYMGLKEVSRYSLKYTESKEILRVFYNTEISLLSFLGSLFYLSRKDCTYNKAYLASIVFMVFTMAFLSATRGWIIAFIITLLLFTFLVFRIGLKGMLGMLIVSIVLVFTIREIPVIRRQIEGSWQRFSTVTAITEGDITLQGTQGRTTILGPRVINKWLENPVFGWGFSSTYFGYNDGHVGNQNILLHSGIVGGFLMLSFLIYFNFKLALKSLKSGVKDDSKSLLVFVLFFIGWAIIHSTSGQQFAFSNMPGGAILQAVFFYCGAFYFYNSVNSKQPESETL